MNEQEIIDIVRAEKPYLCKEFGLLLKIIRYDLKMDVKTFFETWRITVSTEELKQRFHWEIFVTHVEVAVG